MDLLEAGPLNDSLAKALIRLSRFMGRAHVKRLAFSTFKRTRYTNHGKLFQASCLYNLLCERISGEIFWRFSTFFLAVAEGPEIHCALVLTNLVLRQFAPAPSNIHKTGSSLLPVASLDDHARRCHQVSLRHWLQGLLRPACRHNSREHSQTQIRACRNSAPLVQRQAARLLELEQRGCTKQRQSWGPGNLRPRRQKQRQLHAPGKRPLSPFGRGCLCNFPICAVVG